MRLMCVLAGFIVVFLFPIVHSVAQGEKSSLDDKILIIVHMQDDYSDRELSKESTLDEIKKINELVNGIIPENVIYMKATHKILNLTLKKIYVDKIVKDLDERLNVVNENVFTDQDGNIFSSEDLSEYLKNKNTKQIVVVGRVADECITKSILSGLKLGYDMYVVPDAIVGKSEKSKQKSIRKLLSKGAEELFLN